MPGLEGFHFDVLAYGPAPGLEFLPYFVSLLAWAGLAILAILVSPVTALVRRLRGTKNTSSQEQSPLRSEPRPLGSGEFLPLPNGRGPESRRGASESGTV